MPAEGRFAGRVVLITGGARGQGRAHALRFAAEGADIVICDIAAQIESVGYPMSTIDDLEETRRMVVGTGARCISVVGDVRDRDSMEEVVAAAHEGLGPIDILIAQAGICTFGEIATLPQATWHDMIDTNLTGVFNAVQSALPDMLGQNRGRIIATASMAGRAGWENIGHYAAAKWGVIGLIKSVALEVAAHGITANVICPSSVNTPMMLNEGSYRLFRPDLENPTLEDALPAFASVNAQPVPFADTSDISAAAAFLASDEARYISGSTLSVAAGVNARNI